MLSTPSRPAAYSSRRRSIFKVNLKICLFRAKSALFGEEKRDGDFELEIVIISHSDQTDRQIERPIKGQKASQPAT